MADPSQRAGAEALPERQLRNLGRITRELVAELDLDPLLHRLPAAARELTGAPWAALLLTDEEDGRERYSGAGEDVPPPERLREDPPSGALRLPLEVGEGRSAVLWLGPVQDSNGGGGGLAEAFADWAGVALTNALEHSQARQRREELEGVVARLEATSEVGRSIGGDARLPVVLESVAKRARALVGARSLLVLLERHGALEVAASAGEAMGAHLDDVRLAVDGAAWQRVMDEHRPERLDGVGDGLGLALERLGVRAHSALLVPLVFRGRALGALAAFDRVGDGPQFSADDEALLSGFAASAAMAVATAQSLAESKLRESIEAAERERARWARELHDETLQGLGAVRVLLASSLRNSDPERAREQVRRAMGQVEDEIAKLRALITELRPAALDELGLGAAIETLAASHAELTGAQVHVDVKLGAAEARLDKELESAIYRVVQEALTNAAKHADADNVWIEVAEEDGAITVNVRDDGCGFDMDRRTGGFGLVGMRERVALAGGTLAIVATPGHGTELRGRIPLAASDPGAGTRA